MISLNVYQMTFFQKKNIIFLQIIRIVCLIPFWKIPYLLYCNICVLWLWGVGATVLKQKHFMATLKALFWSYSIKTKTFHGNFKGII